MKRHKRKQKQWSKKNTYPVTTRLAGIVTPTFPELSLLDHMQDDPELTELFKDKPHEN